MKKEEECEYNKYEYDNYNLTKAHIRDSLSDSHSIKLFENNHIVYSYEKNSYERSIYHIVEKIHTPNGKFLVQSDNNHEVVCYLSYKNSKIEDKLLKKQMYYLSSGTLKLLKPQHIIEEDGQPCTNDTNLLTEYHTLRDKYHTHTKNFIYHMTSCLLQEAQQLINSYIVTKSLNIDSFYQLLNKLEKVSDIASTSYPLLVKFLMNPHDTDLRALSEHLSKAQKNINSIIELKSEKAPNEK